MNVTSVDIIGNSASTGNIFQLPQMNEAASRSAESTKENSAKGNAVSAESMKKIAEAVQEQINVMNSSLSFQAYGKNNDKIAIVVTDKTTGKVIREIPSHEVQQMQAKLEELIGLIFNGSA